MKRIIFATIVVLTGCLMTGCMLEETTPPELKVEDKEIDAQAIGGIYHVLVTSNATWTASRDDGANSDWLPFENTFVTGNGTITINVPENDTEKVRSAVVTITVGMLIERVVVTQAPPVPLTVNTTKIDATPTAGNYNITVKSSGSWEVTGDTWCTANPSKGSGESTITITVEGNDLPNYRSAIVSIKSGAFVQQVTVIQSYSSLTVAPTSIPFSAGASSRDIVVTGNVSWGANVTFGSDWCRITPDYGNGNGTITVNVNENTTTAERVAIVTIASQNVVVTQAGTAASSSVTVTPTNVSTTVARGTHTVNVTSSRQWTAAISPGATWCTISPTSGTSSGMITVTVQENPNASVRYATITVDNGISHAEIPVTQGFYIDMGEMIPVVGDYYISNFSIGKYEVTQKQWRDVMGNWSPATPPPSSDYGAGDNYPMYNVNWDDVQKFLDLLNEKTGLNYRLPKEVEWEYAAKGGQLTHNYEYSGRAEIDTVAWYDINSESTTHPVGTKKPNELGIYDMSGNVWEWCSDVEGGDTRVIRGGSWNKPFTYCRVGYRNSDVPDRRVNDLGFRLVLSP